MPTPQSTPSQIVEQLKNWHICFWIWNVSHYALGLIATIGTVVIAREVAVNHGALAIVVAVATACLTFFKASTKADAYIGAWRYLNAERICFELDPNYTEAKLAEAHKKGEQIIGKVN